MSLVQQTVLLASGINPSVIEEIVGAAKARPICKQEEFRRDQRRCVLAVAWQRIRKSPGNAGLGFVL